MKINKNNYEAFFLDYHEGNLSPQQVADLLLFISFHPELKEEFENFENVSLEKISDAVFENKNQLKKQIITLENKETYFINAIEGNLSATEKTVLKDFLNQHPKFSVDLDLFKKTKLTADTSIVFKNKNRLKQKEGKVIPLFYYVAIAASILLLIGLFISDNNQPDKITTAGNELPAKSQPLQLKQGNMVNNKENKPVVNGGKLTTVTKQRQQLLVKKQAIKNTIVITEASFNGVVNSKTTGNTDDSIKYVVLQNDVPTPEKQVKNPVISGIDSQEISKVAQTADKIKTDSFLSLPELAVKKIKEKTTDKNAFTANKPHPKKKITGWDVAQIIAGTVNKLTGKDIVEIKPFYNEQGNLTAYALDAGKISFSKSNNISAFHK